MKRRLLWRVRRKLILSYIFIGVVPSLLIVIFFLLGGVLIFMNVSAYLFKDGYDDTFNHLKLATEAAASEISRAPGKRGAVTGADTQELGKAVSRALVRVCPGTRCPAQRHRPSA